MGKSVSLEVGNSVRGDRSVMGDERCVDSKDEVGEWPECSE